MLNYWRGNTSEWFKLSILLICDFSSLFVDRGLNCYQIAWIVIYNCACQSRLTTFPLLRLSVTLRYWLLMQSRVTWSWILVKRQLYNLQLIKCRFHQPIYLCKQLVHLFKQLAQLYKQRLVLVSCSISNYVCSSNFWNIILNMQTTTTSSSCSYIMY